MMKKLFVGMFLLLLAVGAMAYDLNGGCTSSTDLNAIGDCIVRGAFASDYRFFAIIMMACFAAIVFQARVPGSAAIAMAFILSFALMPMLNPNEYTFLLNLMIMVVGILLGLAIIHVRR